MARDQKKYPITKEQLKMIRRINDRINSLVRNFGIDFYKKNDFFSRITSSGIPYHYTRGAKKNPFTNKDNVAISRDVRAQIPVLDTSKSLQLTQRQVKELEALDRLTVMYGAKKQLEFGRKHFKQHPSEIYLDDNYRDRARRISYAREWIENHENIEDLYYNNGFERYVSDEEAEEIVQQLKTGKFSYEKIYADIMKRQNKK